MSSTISSLLFISFSTNHHRHRRHQHFEAIRPRPIFWWQKPQEAGPGCPTNTRPNGHERDDDEGVNYCGDIEDLVALKHVRRNEPERDYEDGVNDGRDIGDFDVQII